MLMQESQKMTARQMVDIFNGFTLSLSLSLSQDTHTHSLSLNQWCLKGLRSIMHFASLVGVNKNMESFISSQTSGQKK